VYVCVFYSKKNSCGVCRVFKGKPKPIHPSEMPSTKKRTTRSASAVQAQTLSNAVKDLSKKHDHERTTSAVETLADIATESPKLHRAVLNAGVVPMLVDLVRSGSEAQPNVALKALIRINNGADKHQHSRVLREVRDAQGLQVIEEVLRLGSWAECSSAAALVISLLKTDSDGTLVAPILDSGIAKRLINLLGNGTTFNDEYAMHALWLMVEIDPTRAKRQIGSMGAQRALKRLFFYPMVTRELKQKAIRLARLLDEDDEDNDEDNDSDRNSEHESNPDSNPDSIGMDHDCGTRLHISLACSGVRIPHVFPTDTYEFPLQRQSDCGPTCTSAFAFTYPSCLDLDDPEAVNKWFVSLADANRCNSSVVFDDLHAAVTSPLPSYFVVREDESSGIHEVYAFLVAEATNKVYAVEVTMLGIGDQRAHELPYVTGSKRRAAFSRLSEAIEVASTQLPEGLYKELYDAAMAVHRA